MYGPTIVLDKSAFQSLARDEIFELDRYFHVVIPPVLLLEILGDLHKGKAGIKSGQLQSTILSRKIIPLAKSVNIDYRTIGIAGLLGERIRMNRVPVIHANRISTKEGMHGYFSDIQPENDALMRWSVGDYSIGEDKLAEQWRATTTDGTLAKLKGMWKKPRAIKIRSLNDAAKWSAHVLNDEDAQEDLLNLMLAKFCATDAHKLWVFARWRILGEPKLAVFSPYTYHCAFVDTVFSFALAYDLIGPRPTNSIDLQYYYYCPFAQVLCSKDKFHRKLSNALLGNDQTFVWSLNLKSALSAIAMARTNATAAGSCHAHKLYPDRNSLVAQLWIKHWKHWPPNEGKSSKASILDKKKWNSVMEAMQAASKNAPPRPRWPCSD